MISFQNHTTVGSNFNVPEILESPTSTPGRLCRRPLAGQRLNARFRAAARFPHPTHGGLSRFRPLMAVEVPGLDPRARLGHHLIVRDALFR
jgi:hypothetical protein